MGRVYIVTYQQFENRTYYSKLEILGYRHTGTRLVSRVPTLRTNLRPKLSMGEDSDILTKS